MFCPRCRVHFAGTSPPPAEAAGAAGGPAETVERRCPYCGGQAEDTAHEPRALGGVGSAQRDLAQGTVLDRAHLLLAQEERGQLVALSFADVFGLDP